MRDRIVCCNFRWWEKQRFWFLCRADSCCRCRPTNSSRQRWTRWMQGDLTTMMMMTGSTSWRMLPVHCRIVAASEQPRCQTLSLAMPEDARNSSRSRWHGMNTRGAYRANEMNYRTTSSYFLSVHARQLNWRFSLVRFCRSVPDLKIDDALHNQLVALRRFLCVLTPVQFFRSLLIKVH